MLGACFEVYKELGCGFFEGVYVDCLKLEMEQRRIPYVAQPRIEVVDKGRTIEHVFVPDFICFDKVILEVKAVNELIGAHRSQVINYLKCTGLEVGLLVNFGHHPLIEHERFAAADIVT